MSVTIFRRPARGRGPELNVAPLDIPAVPATARGAGGISTVVRAVLPLGAAIGAGAMLFSGNNPIRMLAGVAIIASMVLAAIASVIFARTGSRREAREARLGYVDYIGRLRVGIDQDILDYRAAMAWRHPAPEALPQIAVNRLRLFERRRGDIDFLVVRIGEGIGPIARSVTLPGASGSAAPPDPVAAAHADRLLQRAESVIGVPVAVRLRGTVSVLGEGHETGRTITALVLGAAALHAPADLQIMLCTTPDDIGTPPDPVTGAGRFDWMKWLPHTADPGRFDGPFPARRITTDPDEMRTRLVELISARITALSDRGHRSRSESAWDGPTLVVIMTEAARIGSGLGAGTDPADLLPPGVSPEQLGICFVTETLRRVDEPGHVDTRVRVSPTGEVDVTDLTGVLTRLLGGDDSDADGEPDTTDGATAVRSSRSGYDGDDGRISAASINGIDLDSGPGWVKRLILGTDRGTVDAWTLELATVCARRLAPLRLVADPIPSSALEATFDLPSLHDIGDPADLDPAALWSTPRPLGDHLNVPIGADAAGAPVRLDIKESGQNGMGPHGLCVGATGSGKSELLRTLLTSMAIAHPPDLLSFVLVDYKGGAAFAGFERLPHTSASVDNLADDLGLVDRLHDALLGELQRRQRVLADAGNLPNVTEYQRLRRIRLADPTAEPLPPLPALFVVIDEFGEILSAKPDFIDLFVQIGRIGRSIGVHLLLSTQRLEEGRLRGLESHLSYRIGLRTFTAQESRTALGVSDAHTLPAVPGSAILKVDPDVFTRFKAAFVSGPYRPSVERVQSEAAPEVSRFEFSPVAENPGRHSAAPTIAPTDTTTLDVILDALDAPALQSRRIWLPPLPAALPLDQVGAGSTHSVDGLAVAIGLADEPKRQRQSPLTVDFRGTSGNVYISGAPQTGKTTTLRTIVSAGAISHPPATLGFHVIDANGTALADLERLPNTGSVATRYDGDLARRIVADLHGSLDSREQFFASRRIQGIADLRARIANGEQFPEIVTADVVLAIDGWASFKENHEDLVDVVQDIGNRGLALGIHVVIVGGRWADLRMSMQAVIGTKIEHRLNDPLDSTIGRAQNALIRADQPGRVITTEPLGAQAQIALPRLSSDSGFDEVVEVARHRAAGQAMSPVPTLPDALAYRGFRSGFPEREPLLVGINETDLAPLVLDPTTTDQHLLVIGESRSGKTNLLRVIVEELVSTHTDEQLVIGLFDPRRTLQGFVPDDYLGGYAGSPPAAGALAAGIAEELQRRLPPEDLQQQAAPFTGPHIYLIVDDYDLLASGTSNNPLAPLIPYLPYAADIGLHLVVARRSAGISRALYDSVVGGIREHNATMVLFSGDRQEGSLAPGVHLTHQPVGRVRIIRPHSAPVHAQTLLLESD